MLRPFQHFSRVNKTTVSLCVCMPVTKTAVTSADCYRGRHWCTCAGTVCPFISSALGPSTRVSAVCRTSASHCTYEGTDMQLSDIDLDQCEQVFGVWPGRTNIYRYPADHTCLVDSSRAMRLKVARPIFCIASDLQCRVCIKER